MGFVHTKGYLVHNDRDWDVDEFLRGSEYVNDCVHWYGAGGAHYGAFATNADVVVVRLDSNTPLGFARLAGGFAKVARAGDNLYLISKSDGSIVHQIDWTAMSGDSSGLLAAAPLTIPAGFSVNDIHGMTYSSGVQVILAYSITDGSSVALRVFNAITATDYALVWTGAVAPGFFPKGDFDNTLYYAIGPRVHAFYNPHFIAGDSFMPDASYGAIDDEFAGGAIDGRNWISMCSPGATLAQNDRLEFTLANSGPLREALAWYLHACPGDIGVSAKYTVTAEPAPADDEYTDIDVGLATPDGATQYLHRRRRTASGVVNRMEVRRGGALVYSHDATTWAAHPWIAIDRFRDDGVVKIRISASDTGPHPAEWDTIHTYADPDGDMGPLFPALSATNTCATSPDFLRGYFEQFRARDNSAPQYRVRRTTPIYQPGLTSAPITAAAVSARENSNAHDRRQITVVYGDMNATVQVIDTDQGAYDHALANETVVSNTIGTAASGAALAVLRPTQAIRCAAVADDRASVVVGGTTGVQQIDTSDIAHDGSIALMRHYTRAFDHAQPLVDDAVWTIDWRGASFIYGCRSDADPIYGDDWGHGYGYAGHADGGGAGHVTPDFDAPMGADTWAESTHDERPVIRTGARSPDPIPNDYLHAHVERRVNGGAWHRLQTTGWIEFAPDGWDHGADVAFLAPSVPDDAYTTIQDVGVGAGRHEYRWIFHDEAGNAGERAAQTLYGDHVEYRGTPEVTSIVIDADGPIAHERGVAVILAATSGDDAGAVDSAVWQARVWNEGEPEHASPWSTWPTQSAGAAFEHRLSAEPGLKTVRARVRHVSGERSAAVSASIVLDTASLATADTGRERILIAHGDEGPFAFTGDRGRILANSEADGFPASNVRANDLGAAWKSAGLGVPIILPGGIIYRAELVFDLILARTIEIAALLGHNFADIASLSGLRDMSVRLAACDDSGFAGGSFVDMDLTGVATRPTIAHRPQISRRWWRVRMEARFDAAPAHLDTPWSIGRVILNEAAMCFSPAHNYSQRVGVEWTDPSVATTTLGQARRVVDLAPYRHVELIFNDLTPQETEPFETIWRRHRQVKPVLAALDPSRLSKGTDAPDANGEADDPARGVIYGYLGRALRSEGSGWNHSDVRVSIDESVG